MQRVYSNIIHRFIDNNNNKVTQAITVKPISISIIF